MPLPFPGVPVLNHQVLELLPTYPTDGTHPYFWGPGFDGVTSDLYYEGGLIARADEQKRTYCCGLTFEVYLRACERYVRQSQAKSFKLDGLSAWEVQKMKGDWFVAGKGRRGPVDALVSRGLGVQIERITEARPGDFLQFWRENESGHSVIFLSGNSDGITYWSSQTGTDGIGRRTEYFMGKNPVRFDEVYIARAFVPRVLYDD